MSPDHRERQSNEFRIAGTLGRTSSRPYPARICHASGAHLARISSPRRRTVARQADRDVRPGVRSSRGFTTLLLPHGRAPCCFYRVSSRRWLEARLGRTRWASRSRWLVRQAHGELRDRDAARRRAQRYHARCLEVRRTRAGDDLGALVTRLDRDLAGNGLLVIVALALRGVGTAAFHPHGSDPQLRYRHCQHGDHGDHDRVQRAGHGLI